MEAHLRKLGNIGGQVCIPCGKPDVTWMASEEVKSRANDWTLSSKKLLTHP